MKTLSLMLAQPSAFILCRQNQQQFLLLISDTHTHTHQYKKYKQKTNQYIIQAKKSLLYTNGYRCIFTHIDTYLYIDIF